MSNIEAHGSHTPEKDPRSRKLVEYLQVHTASAIVRQRQELRQDDTKKRGSYIRRTLFAPENVLLQETARSLLAPPREESGSSVQDEDWAWVYAVLPPYYQPENFYELKAEDFNYFFIHKKLDGEVGRLWSVSSDGTFSTEISHTMIGVTSIHEHGPAERSEQMYDELSTYNMTAFRK